MPSATYRQSVSVPIPPNDFENTEIACDAGDRVLSAGYAGTNNSTNVSSSIPSSSGTLWSFGFQNLSLASDTVTAYALCADFAPHH
jgi:hypothetical protein